MSLHLKTPRMVKKLSNYYRINPRIALATCLLSLRTLRNIRPTLLISKRLSLDSQHRTGTIIKTKVFASPIETLGSMSKLETKAKVMIIRM